MLLNIPEKIKIPIIVILPKSNIETIKLYFEKGTHDYLVKSFNIQDVKNKTQVARLESTLLGLVISVAIQSRQQQIHCFTKLNSEKATVITDKWKGYRPLMKEYDINQGEW